MKNIIHSILDGIPSLLRVIAFFIFFAGDSDRSKNELNKVLNDSWLHKYLLYLLILVFLSLLGAITFGPYVSQKILAKPTTFNVSAVTEEVKVVTHKTPMSRWPLKNIEISRDCPEDEGDIKYLDFSGSLNINPSVYLTLTRVAFGDLKVTLYSNNDNAVGELYDNEDEFVLSLTSCAFFYIRKINERTSRGETIVLPVTGDISAGSEIRFLTQSSMPILREGQVTILDRSFMTDENYSVGPFSLEAGDTFKVHNSKVSSQGFVLVNENAAINLTFRAKGLRGVIKRYQSEDYELRNSYWSKLYHDESLSLAWILIIVLFNIIRIYLRYLVN